MGAAIFSGVTLCPWGASARIVPMTCFSHTPTSHRSTRCTVAYRQLRQCLRHSNGERPEVRHRGQGRAARSAQDARRVSIGHSRSEEHTSELQSLMRTSYAVFCLKKKQPKHQLRYSQLHTHSNYIKNTKST